MTPEPACPERNGSGRTDNYVTGEVECSACKGSGRYVPTPVGDVQAEPLWVKGAKRLRSTFNEGTWDHALHCNFASHPPTQAFCNCGAAQILKALDDFEAAAVAPDTIKVTGWPENVTTQWPAVAPQTPESSSGLRKAAEIVRGFARTDTQAFGSERAAMLTVAEAILAEPVAQPPAQASDAEIAYLRNCIVRQMNVITELKSALTDAAAALPASLWLPIATCPGKVTRALIHWPAFALNDDLEQSDVRLPEHDLVSEGFRVGGNNWECDMVTEHFEDEAGFGYGEATHWQAIPAPPKEPRA